MDRGTGTWNLHLDVTWQHDDSIGRPGLLMPIKQVGYGKCASVFSTM